MGSSDSESKLLSESLLLLEPLLLPLLREEADEDDPDEEELLDEDERLPLLLLKLLLVEEPSESLLEPSRELSRVRDVREPVLPRSPPLVRELRAEPRVLVLPRRLRRCLRLRLVRCFLRLALSCCGEG